MFSSSFSALICACYYISKLPGKTNINVRIGAAKDIQPTNALYIAYFHRMLQEQHSSTKLPSGCRSYSTCSDEKYTVMQEHTKTHTFLGKYFIANGHY